MTRAEQMQNFTRLQGELASLASAQGWAAPASGQAERIAKGIPAAHSTSEANFAAICRSGRLLSPQALHDANLKTLHPNAVERQLETAGFVFLYAGPFCFSPSGCGLLYARSLEESASGQGGASTFDSGGLIHHYVRPDPAETPLDFLRRHDLPLPEHRNLLQQTLEALFDSPDDYISGIPPRHPGPTGLTGGDRRRWTHEVRIPNEVVLRSNHLRAVFVPTRVLAEPTIHAFLEWCVVDNIDVQPYPAGRDNDFATMASACIAYLNRSLA